MLFLLAALGALLFTAETKANSTLQKRLFIPRPTTFKSGYFGYARYCEGPTQPKHPCFTHWSGSLCDALFSGPTKDALIKDSEMTDFTLSDPSARFTIDYPATGGVRFRYGNYDPSTGCFDVMLFSKGGKWRIWVSDEIGNDRDADTKNHFETGMRFCTKWLHIHVKLDG